MNARPGTLWPRLAPDTQAAAVDGEEPLRYVLRRPDRPAACVRLGDKPAALVFRLDGSRRIDDVVDDAGKTFGEDAPALLVRLLAELGERGFLHEVSAAGADETPPLGPVAQLFRARTWRWRRAPTVIDRIYRCGGKLLVCKPAVVLFGGIATAGLAALVALLTRGRMTPLVVSGHLGLGAACFLGGRAALVVIHELAHGLALSRTGHRVAGAGIKLLAIFPYAFVDTSPVWLEPRRKRMLVTLAGPLSDLVLGGAAAIAAFLTRGVASEISYQLCLAGYLAALLNLNPCLERDGYHLLCDAIRRPGLRVAALIDLQSRLSGRGPRDRARPLRWYGLAVVAWGVAGAGLAVASLSHAFPEIRAALPHDVSLILLGSLWLVLLAPTGVLVGRPLVHRTTGQGREPSPPRQPIRLRRRDQKPPQLGRSPLVLLAHRVLDDASLRQRVRSLGFPPGFEALGARELKSSVAGVVLAAGGESLAIAHTAGVLAPQVEHFANTTVSDTNFYELKQLLGMNDAPSMVTPHLEPNLEPIVSASHNEPILYEPATPSPHAGAVNPLVETTGAVPASAATPLLASTSTLAPWPGNNAGQVALAHWMAEGAAAAGLPPQLPVMAALAESNLDNNACCDHDSLGYFQMREGLWNHGAYAGFYEHPELQLQWFINEALQVRDELRGAGHADFGNDPSTWGNWIADVEKPAAEYRYRYQLELPTAEALLSQPAPLPGAATVFTPSAVNATGPGPASGTESAPDGAHGELVNTPSGQSFRNFLQSLYNQPSAANTGYVPPFANADASWGRTDQGVDVDLKPGDPFVAIGSSRVIGITPDWFEGQPYVWLQLLDGPLAGHYYYVAEQITPSVSVGDVLSPGQPIGNYAASGTGLEMGWSTADGSTLARAVATGAVPSSAVDSLPSPTTTVAPTTPVSTPATTVASAPTTPAGTGATGATGTSGAAGHTTPPESRGASHPGEPTFSTKPGRDSSRNGEPTFRAKS